MRRQQRRWAWYIVWTVWTRVCLFSVPNFSEYFLCGAFVKARLNYTPVVQNFTKTSAVAIPSLNDYLRQHNSSPEDPRRPKRVWVFKWFWHVTAIHPVFKIH